MTQNSIFIATNFKKYHYLDNTLNFWSSWFDIKEGGTSDNFWGKLIGKCSLQAERKPSIINISMVKVPVMINQLGLDDKLSFE